MSSSNLFESINIAKSGLNVAQIQVDITGKNVANSNDEYYTRQRAVSSALPSRFSNGRHLELGGGVKSVDIERIFDEFVYTDYRESMSKNEYNDMLQSTLKQISSLFPELEGYGLSNDLESYFDAWANLTTNPNEPASKIALTKIAKNLTSSIRQMREGLAGIQDSLDKEVGAYVGEINTAIREIASINRELLLATESQKVDNRVTVVNELRDRRDELELSLAKIVTIDVDRRTVETDSLHEESVIEAGEHYILNIGGFNVVDGVDYSELVAKADSKQDSLINIKYVRQDEKEFNLNDYIQKGKVGALLKLRGTDLDGESTIVGYLQNYMNELDVFTQGLIQATNSNYAKTRANTFSSNLSEIGLRMDIADRVTISSNVQVGTFTLNLFDQSENYVGSKEIFIDEKTSMQDIVNQINSNTDDNNDNSPNNDINDKFSAHFTNNAFSINSTQDKGKFFLSIEDGDTNFAGALALRRFFSGSSAIDIDIDLSLEKKPEELTAHVLTKNGKDLLGNYMTKLQSDDIQFYDNGSISATATLGDYFNNLLSVVANDTKMAIEQHNTSSTIHEAITETFNAIGKVNVDEELTNLMKFQAGYVANAKVLTTVDEMLNTLLGIKQ